MSQALKRCSTVVCPDFEFDYDSTMTQIYSKYFEKDSPQSGVCSEDKEAVIAEGKFFGYPGQRCVCFPRLGADEAFGYSECCSGDQKCPISVSLYKEETLGEYYAHLGALVKKAGIADGCCPTGYKKWFLHPEITGADRKLCYCYPPADKVVVREGKPKVHSETSSEFDE